MALTPQELAGLEAASALMQGRIQSASDPNRNAAFDKYVADQAAKGIEVASTYTGGGGPMGSGGVFGITDFAPAFDPASPGGTTGQVIRFDPQRMNAPVVFQPGQQYVLTDASGEKVVGRASSVGELQNLAAAVEGMPYGFQLYQADAQGNYQPGTQLFGQSDPRVGGLMGIALEYGLPIALQFIPGLGQLGTLAQMGISAGATGFGNLMAGNTPESALTKALIAAGTTGIIQGTPVGENINKALTSVFGSAVVPPISEVSLKQLQEAVARGAVDSATATAIESLMTVTAGKLTGATLNAAAQAVASAAGNAATSDNRTPTVDRSAIDTSVVSEQYRNAQNVGFPDGYELITTGPGRGLVYGPNGDIVTENWFNLSSSAKANLVRDAAARGITIPNVSLEDLQNAVNTGANSVAGIGGATTTGPSTTVTAGAGGANTVAGIGGVAGTVGSNILVNEPPPPQRPPPGDRPPEPPPLVVNEPPPPQRPPPGDRPPEPPPLVVNEPPPPQRPPPGDRPPEPPPLVVNEPPPRRPPPGDRPPEPPVVVVEPPPPRRPPPGEPPPGDRPPEPPPIIVDEPPPPRPPPGEPPPGMPLDLLAGISDPVKDILGDSRTGPTTKEKIFSALSLISGLSPLVGLLASAVGGGGGGGGTIDAGPGLPVGGIGGSRIRNPATFDPFTYGQREGEFDFFRNAPATTGTVTGIGGTGTTTGTTGTTTTGTTGTTTTGTTTAGTPGPAATAAEVQAAYPGYTNIRQAADGRWFGEPIPGYTASGPAPTGLRVTAGATFNPTVDDYRLFNPGFESIERNADGRYSGVRTVDVAGAPGMTLEQVRTRFPGYENYEINPAGQFVGTRTTTRAPTLADYQAANPGFDRIEQGADGRYYGFRNATTTTEGLPVTTVTGGPPMAEGGEVDDDMVRHLIEYRKGGGHMGPGQVKGIGSGQEDKIPAWLSDGEYVWSAQDVADLGDGSTDEGVRRLDRMRKMVRQRAGRKDVKKIAKPQRGIEDMLKAVGGAV
jgi:hypothetical protein